MSTSGTYTFVLTRTQIITRALRQIGAIADGETPDASTTQNAADALNALVKAWATTGLHVWAQSEAILFLQPNQAQYALGPGTTDHATDSTTWVQTTLTATASGGATSLSVASISKISSGDNIGIVLDAGTVFWTTVNGAPSGSTVNLAAGLTSQASSGAVVLDYTTNIVRPLRVPFARRYHIADGIETPMRMTSRQEYMDLPDKLSTGTPTQGYYAPLIGAGQLGPGQMYVWPVAPDATNAVRFTWYRPLQDFVNPGDNPDVPQEWANCLVWNLADELMEEYDVPPPRYQRIQTRAAKWLDLAMGFDREPESVYMQVDYDATAR